MRNLIAFLCLWLFALNSLFATDIRSGNQVNISNPVEGDLYVGASTININASINGDLIAASRYCFIRDTVQEDAVIMAQEIYLESPIMDDARLMGGQVHIRADVFGDLFIAGGSVNIDQDVTIHGNLYVGGGTVKLYGRVLGTVELGGGEVFFDGIAEQEATLKAGTLYLSGNFQGPAQLAAEKMEVTAQAEFYQNVRYWTEEGTVDFGPSLKGNSQAQFDESLRTNINDYDWKDAVGVGAVLFTVGRILSAALVIMILVWAFSNFFRRTSERLIGNYATSLGYGMLFLLGVPLLIVIAFITVIGIPVGLFSLATYGISLGFAHILTALLVTYWWQEYQQLQWNKTKAILVAVGVFALLKLVSWIPFIGWLISLAAVATTFGAILAELLRAKREPAEETMEPSELSV